MGDDLLTVVVGPLVRHVLGAVAGYLVLKGWYTPDQGSAAIAALALPVLTLVGTIGYSIYQKIQAALVTKAALSLPAGSSLALAKSTAKEG